jgi:hypothetical protein
MPSDTLQKRRVIVAWIGSCQVREKGGVCPAAGCGGAWYLGVGQQARKNKGKKDAVNLKSLLVSGD